jgi:replicative DNA helicase
MNLQEFISVAENHSGYRAKKVGKEYSVRCPAHDDSTPSLNIREDGDKLLITCFAGCQTENIVSSLGLQMSDLFNNPKVRQEYKILAEYDYFDESGELLYQTLRTNQGKGTFRQPSPDGGWIWSRGGDLHYKNDRGDWARVKGRDFEKGKEQREFPKVRLVLYNLLELLSRPSDVVVCVAGEKNVDYLKKYPDLGFVPVCNVGGENKGIQEYVEFIKDRYVVLIPDNDEAGDKHVRTLYEALRKQNKNVRIVPLPGLTQSGEDIVEWFDLYGHTIEEFLDLLYDCKLPNARLAERAVLGAIFKNNRLINEVIENELLNAFFVNSYKEIVKAMISCVDKNLRIDKITVGEELGSRLLVIGGYDVIDDLIEHGKVEESIEDYLSLIRSSYEARELISVADKVKRGAQTGKNIQQLKGVLGATLNKVAPEKRKAQPMFTLVEKYLQNYGDKKTGVTTGFKTIDEISRGLPKKSLITLAGRPSQGKSTLMMNIATGAAKAGQKVLVLSIEMSGEDELAPKALSAEALVPLSNILNDAMSPEEVMRIQSTYINIPKANLMVDDSPILSLQQIRTKISNYILEYGKLDMVMVDFMQRVKGTKQQRNQEVEEVAFTLKAYAKEFDLAMVGLSQLSRSVETRIDKRPVLADLKESSGVEEASDVVMFIYRDEYYNPTEENKGLTEINFAKGRNIGTGLVKLGFVPKVSRFFDLI